MKISQLYDKEAFKAFKDSGNAQGFQDSDTGVVLARQLTYVNPKLYEKKYPTLAFTSTGIQADNSGGYAKQIQSLRVIEQGGFKDAGDLSDDGGKISLTAEDSTIKVIARNAESVWTEDQVKEAQLQNINLPARFLTAHNKVYQQEIDQLGLVGGIGGKKGILNYAGFTSSAASGVISGLNAQQMYDEIVGLVTDQHNAVNNTAEYKADTVITSTKVINTLSRTILNTAAGSDSVMNAIMKNMNVKFVGSFRAEAVDGGGSVTAAISTNPDAMVMRIPLRLTVSKINQIVWDYFVKSKYRIAGMDFLENTAGRLLTGL